MKLTDFFGLLGGLALFLYGMQMMSSGLEAAAGNKMKRILERLTANRFLGVLVGAGVTAVIQSSSATTVMVVGFVNSGMMTLRQAVWIIMGANIGTTITGQLIALDIGAIAPLIAFIGVALIIFLKSPKVHNYGLIVAGLGVLFLGMEMMSSSMMPLRDSEAFVGLMTKFSIRYLEFWLVRYLQRLFSLLPRPSVFCRLLRQWIDRTSKCGVCPFRTEYRNLYHGGTGVYRNKQERKADDDHPSDIQYDQDGDLYDRLYPDAADRSSGKLDANQRGSPDRQYAYII